MNDGLLTKTLSKYFDISKLSSKKNDLIMIIRMLIIQIKDIGILEPYVNELFPILAENKWTVSSIIGPFIYAYQRESNQHENIDLFLQTISSEKNRILTFEREAYLKNIGSGKVFRYSPIFDLPDTYLLDFLKCDYGKILRIN